MERDNETQNKKRTRADDDHDDGYENNEPWAHKSKKLPAESVVESISLSNNNNISDRIGVFDFPWLKEGVGFKAGGDYFEPEEKFSSFLDFDESSSCVDKELFVGDGNLQEKKVLDDSYEKDGFNWSLKVDDLEPVDNCIWSFVIDQPLTTGLINKFVLDITSKIMSKVLKFLQRNRKQKHVFLH